MNNSRLNRPVTRSMNTRNLTINQYEDNKETVKYSFDIDVCEIKKTSGCQTQSKRLHKSENDSEILKRPNKRIKIAQNLNFTQPEKMKQPNDNGTNDSQEDDGKHGSQENGDTGENQEDKSTDYCQENDDSQEDDDRDYSQEDGDTDDNQEDDDTDDSQEDSCTDDRHKDIFNMKDKADIFYAKHETQVSEGGEADLQKHYNKCKKNPGHTNFVPVNDFKVTHLPEGHYDNDIVELIKATADLTVRLDVKKTSTKRPKFWPKTNVPYAFYDIRGSDVMRVGTGIIWNVNKYTEEDDEGTCQCYKCQHSDTPSKVWGKVCMSTATHVVFDGLEARHTKCRLFYDKQDSPLVTLDGWTVEDTDIKADWCELDYATCDVDIMDKLKNMVDQWEVLCQEVNNKYKSSREKHKLTFIVSHPHGCPKQISVGQWINRYVLDKYRTKYTYTTCTCPGSSGAYVYPVGYNDDWLYYYGRHVHSGVNSQENNLSGVGREDL